MKLNRSEQRVDQNDVMIRTKSEENINQELVGIKSDGIQRSVMKEIEQYMNELRQKLIEEIEKVERELREMDENIGKANGKIEEADEKIEKTEGIDEVDGRVEKVEGRVKGEMVDEKVNQVEGKMKVKQQKLKELIREGSQQEFESLKSSLELEKAVDTLVKKAQQLGEKCHKTLTPK